MLYFFTDVARINPAIAGVILLINKIWDSINDPLIGVISDRVNTRWDAAGRGSCLAQSLRHHLCPSVSRPAFNSAGRFWYYLIVSLMLDLAFTVVNVPYTALTPELTRDYDERTSLNSYRFAFSIAAVSWPPFCIHYRQRAQAGRRRATRLCRVGSAVGHGLGHCVLFCFLGHV